MGIFSRFGDIINSNLNALLDRAEDPAKMIRLMIQEMEETLIEVRTTSARVIADRKEQARRLERLTAEAQSWSDKAKLALEKNREDLARAALAEKRHTEDAVAVAERELHAIDDQLSVLQQEISQLQQKLDDAKAKQQSLLVREQTVRSRMDIRRSTDRDRLDEAFRKFEAYERKMDDLEAQVEAKDIGRNKTLHEEFADLERDDNVERELAALKAQLKQKSDRSDAE